LNRDPFEIPLGTGSGFLWDEEGHIVTNYHVVKGASRLLVTLGNKPQMEARFVGAEPEKDVAVLKIEALRGTLRPLPIGTSGDLEVGQKVFAIGNPFGLDQTLTTGVISGLGREIDPSAEQGDGEAKSSRKIQDVIQIDAAINPGNSGGPLLDSAGRLIGINTAIIRPSGVYAGIGFAVPVDTVNFVVPQIIRSGRADRPALGITILPDSMTERLRQGGLLSSEGVLVSDVIGPSATAAGIRPTRRSRDGKTSLGDLITAIDDQPVKDTPGLFKIIEKCQVGQTVTVTLRRDDAELKVPLVLQERPRVSE
jgi:S1-C subfamily serine protease